MLSDITAWFITMFVITPIQADVQTHLQSANASAETAQQVQQCISTHGPQLMQRAGEDPMWAVTTAIGVTIGWTAPAQILDQSDPNCVVLANLLEDGDQENQGS
jgi:uncharacterized membrane protein YeiB